jgi:hypothetical protein
MTASYNPLIELLLVGFRYALSLDRYGESRRASHTQSTLISDF